MHCMTRLRSSSAVVSGTVLWAVALRRISKISSPTAMLWKRTPMRMTHSSGIVFSPMPPLTMPQLMSRPRGMSFWASISTILWAASSTADRPFSGAMPEWDATPWTVMRTGPPPLRPTTKRLSMYPVSKLNAARALWASWAKTSLVLENMWRFSSSPAKMNLTGRSFQPAAARAFTTYSAMTRPGSMSRTPGPWAMPSSSTRKGFSLAAPSLNTVSMWPMSSRGPCRSPCSTRR